MARNDESHFEMLPHNNFERSKFSISQTHKTTFNAGKLIPFFVEQDVLPGDTFKIDTSLIIRMTTPMFPVMDNCYLDLYYFFIPNRLLWKHWKDFNGENRNGAWKNTTEYEVPHFKVEQKPISKGTIADYMGVPINKTNFTFSQLPIRAYVLTWNEWFRDQNVTAPIEENTEDNDITINNDKPEQGGIPLDVYKYHDYFTSALPEPQKGEAIRMPIGKDAIVKTKSEDAKINDIHLWTFKDTTTENPAVRPSVAYNPRAWFYNNTSMLTYDDKQKRNNSGEKAPHKDIPKDAEIPYELIADLTQATAATINALRLATQTQRIFEKDARGGTRYTEIIRNHFGVTSPDGRQQRPEYLGGKRIPITINQVLQTSSTDSTSPQGNTGAFSLTGDSDESFTKSFTEHGIILGLACVRQDHTYQQGLERGWSRRRRFDYYLPTLAHLGEQPIYMKELYLSGDSVKDMEVFGYQERWAEYRYKPNRISGELRSTYNKPLDAWHYGDKYEDRPILSTEFLIETPKYIDRSLSVQSNLQDQFIADFYIDITAVRPMPIYSVPGMLDHF